MVTLAITESCESHNVLIILVIIMYQFAPNFFANIFNGAILPNVLTIQCYNYTCHQLMKVGEIARANLQEMDKDMTLKSLKEIL